jgi:3-hydroxyisobutyrate dehydrogenase-like beta-hydroxyacid dehydrogenase
MTQTIGFIGLGRMGLPMAANLLRGGFTVRAFNRTASRAQELAGATVVMSTAETAERGGIVISMLTDDAALRAVATDDLARALGPGGVHVSMSTVSPDMNGQIAESFKKHGVTTIAAPVFGRPEAAAAAKLWICVSGDAATKQRVRPVFDAMGQGVFDFGEAVGAANVVKLAGNFLLTAAIEAMAEAAALGEKHGIPRATLLNFFTATLFGCPIYNNYSKRLADADFDKVGFKAELALKDMRLARDAAIAGRVPMPTLDLLCQRYLTAMANGRGELDATVLAGEVARQAGLDWKRE